MVIDRLHTHAVHELVEHLGSGAFEERVGGAFATNAVHDVTSLVILLHHLGDGIDVILKVGVDRNSEISILAGGIEACHEGILVAHIASQFKAAHVRVTATILLDELPSAVARAIVHIEDVAPLSHQSVTHHAVEQGGELLVGLWQHFLLVVARHHYR